MVSRILAFRPATVVARLAPRSDACPLSARELLGPAAELRLMLPIVRVPDGAVARAVLVAAKELKAVVGLALPPGVAPEAWFGEVTRAADELAAALPILLCGEVVVGGEGAMEVARASREAWRLAQAGLTHLAFDVSAIGAAERGRIFGELARAAVEHGIGVEAIVALGDGSQLGRRAAAAMLEHAVAPDVLGVRCHAPADGAEARLQAAALARACGALGGTPVSRRGPVTPELLDVLRGSPLRACEDGGAVAERAAGPVARGEASSAGAVADRSPGESADRLEARAYVEAVDLIERLGAGGSATAVTRALERRLEDR